MMMPRRMTVSVAVEAASAADAIRRVLDALHDHDAQITVTGVHYQPDDVPPFPGLIGPGVGGADALFKEMVDVAKQQLKQFKKGDEPWKGDTE